MESICNTKTCNASVCKISSKDQVKDSTSSNCNSCCGGCEDDCQIQNDNLFDGVTITKTEKGNLYTVEGQSFTEEDCKNCGHSLQDCIKYYKNISKGSNKERKVCCSGCEDDCKIQNDNLFDGVTITKTEKGNLYTVEGQSFTEEDCKNCGHSLQDCIQYCKDISKGNNKEIKVCCSDCEDDCQVQNDNLFDGVTITKTEKGILYTVEGQSFTEEDCKNCGHSLQDCIRYYKNISKGSNKERKVQQQKTSVTSLNDLYDNPVNNENQELKNYNKRKKSQVEANVTFVERTDKKKNNKINNNNNSNNNKN
ncbi:hypothetical protein U3516DRAFT_897999, partial [Neocallimastix sp. 'constans']